MKLVLALHALTLRPLLMPLGCATRTTADAPRALDEAWRTQAQRALAQREYRVSDSSKGLQAPNRRHGLRTYFARGFGQSPGTLCDSEGLGRRAQAVPNWRQRAAGLEDISARVCLCCKVGFGFRC